jgi:23S rRNA (uracil1939-C5)-methyltransferase
LNKSKYNVGDTLTVKIEKIVPNGFGLAFGEKLTVFVPLSAAGDELIVQIVKMQRRTAFAEIVEILKPSNDRTKPECSYFGTCGGCNFQHLNYGAQLDAKIAILRDCLTRLGKINYEGEINIIPSPQEYNYRARAGWHLDVNNKRIGYYKRRSHEVIDVKECPILVPELEKKLGELRQTINWKDFAGKRPLIEAAAANGKVSVYSPDILEPTEEICFEANGERYFYDAAGFFQGNNLLVERLVETATRGASGEFALDLYCGVGLFTLPLARKFVKVIGVEENKRAVELAEKNIEQARLENVRFFDDNVGDFLSTESAKIDFVLLDPPRSGTEHGTIRQLIALKPREISYVACEPSMLARDLRNLLDADYSINSITALDLFPQTHHVETVVRLTQNS